MKIKEVTEEHILFDNGSKITYKHEQYWCEVNFADFEQIEEQALKFDFDEELYFEEVKKYGFRFGNKNRMMFFIPCYSIQNGFYGSDVDILYNGKNVLEVWCKVEIG